MLILAAFGVLGFIGLHVYQNHNESKLKSCLTDLLTAEELQNISIEVKNRGSKPLLQGTLNQKQQQTLVDKLQGQCGTTEIHNFMQPPQSNSNEAAAFQLSIDNYNQTILLQGQVQSKSLKQALIRLVASSYPNMAVSEMLQVDKTATINEIEENLALVLTQIHSIEMAKITLKPAEITLEGLVRDKVIENEVVSQFALLFEPKIKINNQLERVLKNKSLFDDQFLETEDISVPAIEIDLPEIDKPKN